MSKKFRNVAPSSGDLVARSGHGKWEAGQLGLVVGEHINLFLNVLFNDESKPKKVHLFHVDVLLKFDPPDAEVTDVAF